MRTGDGQQYSASLTLAGAVPYEVETGMACQGNGPVGGDKALGLPACRTAVRRHPASGLFAPPASSMPSRAASICREGPRLQYGAHVRHFEWAYEALGGVEREPRRRPS
jgi:hypothetical protein